MKMNKTSALIIISITMLLFSVHTFFTSIHNIDVCQNDVTIQRMVEKQTGVFIPMKELTITLDEVDIKTCYVQGLKWSIYSAYMLIVSSVLLGYNLPKMKRVKDEEDD